MVLQVVKTSNHYEKGVQPSCLMIKNEVMCTESYIWQKYFFEKRPVTFAPQLTNSFSVFFFFFFLLALAKSIHSEPGQSAVSSMSDSRVRGPVFNT